VPQQSSKHRPSPAIAGVKLAVWVVSVVYITVSGAHWAFTKLLKRSCLERLESLELASKTFLNAVAGALSREKDLETGWPTALRAGWETSPLPPGFAVVLFVIDFDSVSSPQSRILNRFSTERIPGLDDLTQPLNLSGMTALISKATEEEQGMGAASSSGAGRFENPWDQDRLWPLEAKRISMDPGVQGCAHTKRFVVLFCHPEAIRFGARWATPALLPELVSVGPGAQPFNPSFDSTAFTLHVVHWFGTPRAFVALDQGFHPAAQWIGFVWRNLQKNFAVVREVFLGGVEFNSASQCTRTQGIL